MRLFGIVVLLAAAVVSGSGVPGFGVPGFADEPQGGSITVDYSGLPVIAADDAVSNVGKSCTVEFVVKSSRHLEDRGTCFLNSKKDHRELHNFTVVIFSAGMDQFKAKGIADPSQHYLDKKIRVSGRIDERDKQPQIVVESPAQIAVAE